MILAGRDLLHDYETSFQTLADTRRHRGPGKGHCLTFCSPLDEMRYRHQNQTSDCCASQAQCKQIRYVIPEPFLIPECLWNVMIYPQPDIKLVSVQ